MSALPAKAYLAESDHHVRFVPEVEMLALLAESMLDNAALKELLAKKW
jgi:hypothetical protein